MASVIPTPQCIFGSLLSRRGEKIADISYQCGRPRKRQGGVTGLLTEQNRGTAEQSQEEGGQ